MESSYFFFLAGAFVAAFFVAAFLVAFFIESVLPKRKFAIRRSQRDSYINLFAEEVKKKMLDKECEGHAARLKV